MQLFPRTEKYIKYSCSLIPQLISCRFVPLQSDMANNHALSRHSHREDEHSMLFFWLVECVLWVNIQSQPTSALPEISTIFLLFTHSLYKWRSQLHGVQGEANQMNHGKERDCNKWPKTDLYCLYLHTGFSSSVRNTNGITHSYFLCETNITVD